MLPPHIFPTGHRGKHSHLVSYPLGAEALSRALDGVPQHALLRCDFNAGNTHQHLDKPVKLVLSALYRRRERSFYDGQDAEARGVLSPFWTISVFAVPRADRHAVKMALLNEGLPNMLKPWLIAHAAITGKVGSCGINIEHVVATGALVTTTMHAIQPDRA